MTSISCVPSLCVHPPQRNLLRPINAAAVDDLEIGQQGFSGHRRVPHRHQRLGAIGEEDIAATREIVGKSFDNGIGAGKAKVARAIAEEQAKAGDRPS